MTAAIDIDALIAAEPLEPAREVKDAAVHGEGPDLARASQSNGTGVTKQRGVKRILKLLHKAVPLNNAGDHAGAARLALQAVDIDEDCAVASHVLGLALDGLGHLSKALECYERAWRLDPHDPVIYYNLGMTAWKLDMLDASERFYRIAHSMDPDNLDALVNLTGVMRDQGRFDDAIEMLRAGIYACPENEVLWNALGTALLEAGRAEEAIAFYTEALRLRPEFARAWHNMAYARNNLGDLTGAVEAYDEALKNPASHEDCMTMTYGRSLSLLAAGRIAEGWEAYDVRMEPDYRAGTLFMINRPRWDAVSDLRGSTFLLVGEQGLGDEVLYLNAADDLIEALGPDGTLKIACERRLIPLLQRSFPGAEIGPHVSISKEGRSVRAIQWVEDWDAVDAWAPAGTLLKAYRPNLESFPSRTGYLKADAERVEAIRTALGTLPAGPKVGVCWKSKLMTAKRTKYFSAFDAWRPVLQTPGVTFVSMQYGDVDDEIELARRELGVDIHQIPGLDLLDDLDGVAAAGSALDLTIGPMNASTNLAAATGGRVWFIAHRGHWPRHNTDDIIWYPGSRTFGPDALGDWAPTMADIADALDGFAQERAAA